ncbi:MAG TPA: hypothetical protein VF577_06300 [Allosphingosinicella sp.]|jgi:hypothetical protein
MPIAALLLALAAAPRDGLPPGAAEPVAGRCHMGECEWFAELERETVRRSRATRLVRLRLIAGRSSVREGEDYSESWGSSARVEWQAEPYDSWIFCSRDTPAVVSRVGNGYVADPLSGPVPAPLQTAARLYIHACGREPGTNSSDAEPAEIELARPEDMFGLRRTVPVGRTNRGSSVARRDRSR